MSENIGTIKLSLKQEPRIEGRPRNILLGYMKDHKIDTSGTNYDLMRRILLHFFPSGVQNQVVISNIELKDITSSDEKVGRWLIGPKIASTDLIGKEIIYFKCRRHYNRIFVDGIITRFENISPYDLVTSCSFEVGDKNFNDDTSIISRLLSIPQRRKQVKNRVEQWSEYLDFQEVYVKKNQFSAVVIRSNYNLNQGSIEIVVAVPFEFEQKLNVLRRETKMKWVIAELSSQDRYFIPNEKKRYDINGLGVINKKYKKERRGNYLKEELESNELPFKIFIDLDDDIINRMMRSNEPNRYIPNRGDFLINAIGGDLAPIINQKRAITRLLQQEMVNFSIGDFIFDYSEATPTIDIMEDLPFDPLEENINENQKRSLLKILSAQDIALVQGPPGTGKTTIIAELCYQLAKDGKRILVTSQTNLAVDNALSRLQNNEEILPIRLGYATEEGQQFVEENVVNYWFNSVAENVEERVKNERVILEIYREAIDTVDNIGKISAQISPLIDSIHSIKSDIKELKAEIEPVRQEQLKQNNEKQRLSTQKLFLGNIMLSSDQPAFQTYIEGKKDLINTIKTQLNSDYSELEYDNPVDLYAYSLQSRMLTESYIEISNKIGRLVEVCNGVIEVTSPQLEKLYLEQGRLKGSTSESELRHLLRINKDIQELKSSISVFDQSEWFDLLEYTAKLLTPYNLLANKFEPIESSLKPDNSSISTLISLNKLVSQNMELINVSLAIDERLRDLVNQDIKSINEQIDIIDGIIVRLQDKIDGQQSQMNIVTNKLSSINSKVGELIKLRNEALLIIKTNTQVETDLENPNLSHLSKEIEAWFNKNQSEYNISIEWSEFRQRWLKKIKNRSKQDLEDLTSVYIDAANVVGATCYFSGQKKFYENAQKFDYVIVDEVSKATAPELLMPMLLAEKIVLVGDHRQLPPLFQEEKSFKESDDPHAEETLARFKKLVTSSYFEDAWTDIDPSLKERLNEQYRMHEHIMRAVNLFYQDGPLKLGYVGLNQDKIHNISVSGFLSPSSHLVWVDSSYAKVNGKDVRNFAEKRDFSTSRYNQLELDSIKQILKILNKSGGKLDVGVITFYGDQVRKIRDLINSVRANLNNLSLTHGTVDRFQGAEREIIIVSLVGALKGRWVTGFVKDFRRINVAISRAQKLLIIIGATEDFRRANINLEEIGGSRSSQPYQTIIDLVKQYNGYQSASKILGLK